MSRSNLTNRPELPPRRGGPFLPDGTPTDTLLTALPVPDHDGVILALRTKEGQIVDLALDLGAGQHLLATLLTVLIQAGCYDRLDLLRLVSQAIDQRAAASLTPPALNPPPRSRPDSERD